MHSFLTLDLKEGVDLALNTNWRADAKSQKTEKVNKFFQQKAVSYSGSDVQPSAGHCGVLLRLSDFRFNAPSKSIL